MRTSSLYSVKANIQRVEHNIEKRGVPADVLVIGNVAVCGRLRALGGQYCKIKRAWYFPADIAPRAKDIVCTLYGGDFDENDVDDELRFDDPAGDHD